MIERGFLSIKIIGDMGSCPLASLVGKVSHFLYYRVARYEMIDMKVDQVS